MDKVIKELIADRQPLVEKCRNDEGCCSRADVDQQLCKVYAYPTAMWKNGDCLMADNNLRTETAPKATTKVRVGQQKQKKKR